MAAAGASAWLALGVLVVATIVGAVDRQLLVLLAEPLKHSLGLSDTQLGLLQGAGITLFAGLAAFPLGWLADRYDRRVVLAGCVLLWSASTAACGLARDFPQMLLAASGLGLGEAGLVPIVYSLIPDLFPRGRRAAANALYAIAAVFGAGIGLWSSSLLLSWADAWARKSPELFGGLEGWRVAFLLAACLGPVVAPGVALLRIRRRGDDCAADARAEEAQRAGGAGGDVGDGVGDGDAGRARPRHPLSAAPALLPYLRRHARALAGIFGGVGAASLGMSAVVTWLPVVAVRHFHASVTEAGQAVGLGFAAGTLIGGIFSALQSRLHARFGATAWVRSLGISVGLAGVAAIAMPAMDSLGAISALFSLLVAATFAGAVIYANLIQLVTPPQIRSRVLAINAAVTAIASAISPVAVGALSDRLPVDRQALLLAVALVAACALLPGAFIVLRNERSIVRSVQEVGG